MNLKLFYLYTAILVEFQEKYEVNAHIQPTGFKEKSYIHIYIYMFIHTHTHTHVCMHAKSRQSCPTLWPFGLELSRFLYLWDYPGKNTGVGCHALLQGIFPTQGLNPCLLCLLHRQATLVPPGVQVCMYICVYILSYSSLLWSCWNLRQIIFFLCSDPPSTVSKLWSPSLLTQSYSLTP